MEEDTPKEFFISYYEQDRKWAEWISWQLEDAGHECFIKAWDTRPGANFVVENHKALQQVKRYIAVLSPAYLDAADVQSGWTTALALDPNSVQGKLLPVRVQECKPEGLFAPIKYIDMVGLHESVARDELLAGIRPGRAKPLEPSQYPGSASNASSPLPEFPGKSNVLIASLGDSPAVISAMYDRLTEQENLSIDRVVILCPEDDKDVDEDVKCAYELVKRALSELIAEDRLIYEPLPFRDVDSWRNGCIFLKRLHTLLRQHQEKGDNVYLSLAGGRKNMAALMAWVVPFFPCIEGLYHIIDREEQIRGPRYFLPVRTIARLPERRFERVMHLPRDQVILVDIPFEKGKQISRDTRRKLTSGAMDELLKGKSEAVEARIVGQIATQDGEYPLDVRVTEEAKRQFELLGKRAPAVARLVRNSLLTLSEIDVLLDDLQLSDAERDTLSVKLDGSTKTKKLLRYFKGLEVPVRPVFYTNPHELADYPGQQVDEVVVCSLEQEEGGTYRSLREVKAARGISAASDLLAPPEPAESVLIVPLGTSPMVATQLYTLLEKQMQRTIRALVLIYPEQSQQIDNGVRIIGRLLPREVHCEKVEVKGYEDIDSMEACRDFQQVVEQQIEWARDEYRGCKVDLALSGGRKGMTAMTIFAAQRKNIPFVYHTLITDDDLSEEIEEKTTIGELSKPGLTDEQLRARLFLDEYSSPDEPYPYSCFKLFRVPVFPSDDL